MKHFIQFCSVAIILFTACKEVIKDEKVAETLTQEITYDSFGVKISSEKAITSQEMLVQFNTLKVGDTINVKFTSSIKEVCVKKGCWMKLPLNEDSETMVRFKDYGFFMPLDSKGQEVIVNGKAFIQETSVEDLKHYAEDAGKSKEEIAKITEPKKEFSFEADGVLIKSK